MSQNIGAYWLFANIDPVWVLAGSIFITHVGYWIFVNLTEGPAQTLNVSASGYVGYFGLGIIIAMGAQVLHRPVTVPAAINSLWFDHLVMAGALAVGYKWSRGEIVPRGRWSDWYHSWIVVPALAYFVFFALCAVVAGGTDAEIRRAVVFICLSPGLVWYDFATGRMNQPRWRYNHGVKLPTKHSE